MTLQVDKSKIYMPFYFVVKVNRMIVSKHSIGLIIANKNMRFNNANSLPK